MHKIAGVGGRPGGLDNHLKNQAAILANLDSPVIEFAQESQGLANHAQGRANENPGALAGATGAEYEVSHFKEEEYRKRAEAATALCRSIAQCDRDDAVLILSAALVDLSMGAPLPVWLSALDDARWWASLATEIELKAFLLASFEALRPTARRAFLVHVQARVAA